MDKVVGEFLQWSVVGIATAITYYIQQHWRG